jgi:hypothetical protein
MESHFETLEYGKTKGSKLTIQLHCDENQSPFFNRIWWNLTL